MNGTRRRHERDAKPRRALGLLLAAVSFLGFVPVPASAHVVFCVHVDGSSCLESSLAPCCEDEGCPAEAAATVEHPERPAATNPGNPCCRDVPLSSGGVSVASPGRAASTVSPASSTFSPAFLPGAAGVALLRTIEGRAPPGPPPRTAPSPASRTTVLRC